MTDSKALREALQDLIKYWRESTVGIGNYATMRPLTLNERDIARSCAEQLEQALSATPASPAGSGASEPPMTPQPSDSMSERARELAHQIALGWLRSSDEENDFETFAAKCAEPALDDAFNLGAGGAYADAVQIAQVTWDKNPSALPLYLGAIILATLRQRTPADALEAVERKKQ